MSAAGADKSLMSVDGAANKRHSAMMLLIHLAPLLATSFSKLLSAFDA